METKRVRQLGPPRAIDDFRSAAVSNAALAIVGQHRPRVVDNEKSDGYFLYRFYEGLLQPQGPVAAMEILPHGSSIDIREGKRFQSIVIQNTGFSSRSGLVWCGASVQVPG